MGCKKGGLLLLRSILTYCRTITVVGQNNQTYSVFLYRTNSNVPRPESYREDLVAASTLPDDAKPLFYQVKDYIFQHVFSSLKYVAA